MPHDVIMPALGMAQDKGVIVAWHKKLGDEVKADDVLMEIETDKATMEVEAGHAGFVAELRAGEGDAIPVGDVVAVISESANDVKDAPTPADESPEPGKEQATVRKAEPETPKKPEPVRGKAPVKPSSDHSRVLASPKAKLTAAERGIDLKALVRQGISEPIHLADLDQYRPASAAANTLSVLTAKVGSDAFERFATWAKGETETPAMRAHIFAAFAAGALRSAADESAEPIVLSAQAPLTDGEPAIWADPDLAGFSDDLEADGDHDPTLALIDLTNSGLSGLRAPNGEVAALVIADDGEGFALSLHFDDAAMPLSKAARLLSVFSARLADPLRQLL
jgi:pyruvate/2-oxoglutarate dehydrogenase complex dihydrolipoamide acyltransferase (E2) component